MTNTPQDREPGFLAWQEDQAANESYYEFEDERDFEPYVLEEADWDAENGIPDLDYQDYREE